MNIQAISRHAKALCDNYGAMSALMIPALIDIAVKEQRPGDTTLLHAVKQDCDTGSDPLDNVIKYLIRLYLV